jgi:hypothetical protein
VYKILVKTVIKYSAGVHHEVTEAKNVRDINENLKRLTGGYAC